MQTVRFEVFGRVQGVWFRDYTRRKAHDLGLTGWVRNRADGSVEVLVQGSQEQVAGMLLWLHEGSPNAQVEQVNSLEAKNEEMHADFQIRHD